VTRGAAGDPTPPLSASWPFVGRAGELARVDQGMVDPTESGLVVEGPPGIGKTRFIQEVAERADPARCAVLRATATRATMAIPLGALAPLLPANLPSTSERLNLLRAAADALLGSSGDRRLVLLVDDAHLLDDISVALLHQLVRFGNAYVLVTIRSGEPPPEPIVALWASDLIHRIDLQPLTQGEVHQLLTGALGTAVEDATAERLWWSAQGNILLLRELVRAALDTGVLRRVEGAWQLGGPLALTPHLMNLVDGRIRQLGPEEVEVLELLAYGEPLSADLLSRLVPASAIEALESRLLITVELDRRRRQLRLGHPLYGDAMRSRCPRLRAWRLQGRLAEAVEAAGGRRIDDPLRIAVWRLESGNGASADLLLAGGWRAWAMLDLALAGRLGRAALEAGGGVAAGQLLWRVLLLESRNAEAERLLAGLADAAADDSERTEIASGRVYHLFWGLDDPSAALAVLDRAVAEVADPERRDELLVLRAALLAHLGEAGAALEALAGIERLQATKQQSRATVGGQIARGLALAYLGQSGEAIPILRRAAHDAVRWLSDLPWVVQWTHLVLCQASVLAGEFEDASRLAGRWYDSVPNPSLAWGRIVWCLILAQAERGRGHLAEAGRWLRQGLDLLGEYSLHGRTFASLLFGESAHVAALRGDLTAAEASLREAEAHRQRSQELFWPWIEMACPWVAAAAGDRRRGAVRALELAERARARGALDFEALALHDAARLGVPAKVAGRLGELAATLTSSLVAAYARHAGAAAGSSGTALEAVAAEFEALGADLLAAEAAAEAARAYGRAGKRSSEARATIRARALAERCGGALLPALDPRSNLGLTPREWEVASLAAQGLSNQSISEQLVISPRTVGNHLHNLYRKLGVKGRDELSALFGEGG